MLKKKLNGKLHEWAEFVPYTQLAYNARISSTTGITPFRLMFGRHLNKFTKYQRKAKSALDLALWQKKQDEVHSVIYQAITERIRERKFASAEILSQVSKNHRPNHVP